LILNLQPTHKVAARQRVMVVLASLLLMSRTLSAPSAPAPTVSAPVSPVTPVASLDILHYDARIEPDITRKTIAGEVSIRFVIRTGQSDIQLDCGDLTIDSVREHGEPRQFSTRNRRLNVDLSRPEKSEQVRQLDISYHGAPTRGIRFFPERQQVYTIFSTSQWMICVDDPADKATLRLTLVLPKNLRAVANGQLVSENTLPNGKLASEWRQDKPVSTYIFGFAAGPFRELTERSGRVTLRYLAERHSEAQMQEIFRDTSDMLRFFEDRSGVPYADKAYTQVLAAGGVEQEMSSFTALRETYGDEILADPKALWLGAHEFAHQWWGNMVTCVDWRHFWLNEGMATFMAAAYKEHRFGRQDYLSDIDSSRKRYENVRDAGKDRSLVFPDWDHPTPEDRALVYHKGCYVLHLLREHLGDGAFWNGIRLYTRRYFGKSVVTEDFQKAMEEASGRNLTDFFAKWIYLTRR
jgi:aminopeptidase N